MNDNINSYDLNLANKFGIEVAIVYEYMLSISAEFYSNSIFHITGKEVMQKYHFVSRYKVSGAFIILKENNFIKDYGGGYYKICNWDDVVDYKKRQGYD